MISTFSHTYIIQKIHDTMHQANKILDTSGFMILNNNNNNNNNNNWLIIEEACLL